jgi:hypothetical protein
MMKLGILLNNLGPNQLAYTAIRNNNFYVDRAQDFDCILFYENYVRPCLPMNFASMQVFEAYGYDGTLVATSLSSAHKALECYASKKKFFYVWDLEWMRLQQFKQFRDLHNIYANKELTLIARSQQHKDVIEDSWNVNVAGVVDNFDMRQMAEVIKACQT